MGTKQRTKAGKVVRVVGGVLGALVLLAGAGLLSASLKVSALLSRQFASHHVDIPVPNPLTDEELAALRAERTAAGAEASGDPLAGVDLTKLAAERAIARGKHLVDARYGCNACHGADFAGGLMLDDPAIGVLRGPNLTGGKGGLPADYSMADWDRIVRHGIKRDGTPAVMPSQDFFMMSDQELSDIVAYIRSRPNVDAEVPAPSFGPVGKVLLALGKFPLSADMLPDHQRAHERVAPRAADTAEFGAHLAATCTGCHRDNLAGGPMPFGPPSWPAAANLTRDESGLGSWTFEEFERALTQGVSRDGRALREPMTHVLPGTRAMTSLERKALWTYLRSLAPAPTNS
jgi:mono/diheme cytochrome c family protein